MHILVVVVALAALASLPLPAAAAPSPRGPDAYLLALRMSTGVAGIHVVRAASPLAADRVYAMATAAILDDSRFFRVIRNDSAGTAFVAQWGIPGNPAFTADWLPDELPNEAPGSIAAPISNIRSTVALGGEYNADRTAICCRSIEMYINYDDNSRLDALGFTPFGAALSLPALDFDAPEGRAWAARVLAAGIEINAAPGSAAMAPFDALNAHYGEAVDWDKMYAQGNAYLDADLPGLSRLYDMRVIATYTSPPGPPVSYMAPQERLASTLTLTAFAIVALGISAWTAFSWWSSRSPARPGPPAPDSIPLVV